MLRDYTTHDETTAEAKNRPNRRVRPFPTQFPTEHPSKRPPMPTPFDTARQFIREVNMLPNGLPGLSKGAVKEYLVSDILPCPVGNCKNRGNSSSGQPEA